MVPKIRVLKALPGNALRQLIFLATILAMAFAGRVPAQTPVPEATNLWLLKLDKTTSSTSPALAPDGTIYIATFDGTLLAITPEGKIHWKFNTGTETDIKSSPAVADDGTIYFGSRNRKFYAVSPDGKLRWTFPAGAWVDSSPAIAADGTIYFGSWDKNFYALSPAGTPKWTFAVGAIVTSSPAVAADGTIYFGAFDQNFYALGPDGKVKWTFATGGGITSSPAIGPDGTVYFTSTDGNLYALKSDGTEQWHFHTGSYTASSPVLDDGGQLYVAGLREEYCVGVDGRGHTISGVACPVDATAVTVTGQVYCSRPWRTLKAFRSNGEVLWNADTARNLSASPVVGSDGTVYATCENFLYAIRPAVAPLSLAKSSWPMFHTNPRHTGRVGNSPGKL